MSYYSQLGIHSSILMKKLNHLVDDTIAIFRQALIPNSRDPEDSLKVLLNQTTQEISQGRLSLPMHMFTNTKVIIK